MGINGEQSQQDCVGALYPRVASLLRRKEAVFRPKMGHSWDSDSNCSLILDSSVFRTVRNTFLMCIPRLGYGILSNNENTQDIWFNQTVQKRKTDIQRTEHTLGPSCLHCVLETCKNAQENIDKDIDIFSKISLSLSRPFSDPHSPLLFFLPPSLN